MFRTKAWKAFYLLKTNVLSEASKKTKLNAYIKYALPGTIYASPSSCLAYTNETTSMEGIQRKTTSWILSYSSKGYKEQLMRLKLSPCFE